jgi:hypothetical protein
MLLLCTLRSSKPEKLRVEDQIETFPNPDTFGQKWNIQLMMVPVIPKLIKGNLIE